MQAITLFKKFNIEWAINQANGNGLLIFEGRTRKETLGILTDLQKKGYTTIRAEKDGTIAE